ncbi:MAG: DUF4091 domain-containing protein [Polyangiaceae bacterium]
MRTRTLALAAFAAATALLFGACDGGGDGNTGGGGAGGQPTCTDCTPTGDRTFALPSPAGAVLWTTTTMDKVLREAAPPSAEGSAIEVRAAKNEYEPFQIVVRADSAGTATLSMTPFKGPGELGEIELRKVGYVTISQPSDPGSIPSGRIPDPLDPAAFGAPESVPGGENQPFWITVHIPKGAPAGDYTSTLTVTVGGDSAEVPIKLHVFDFALPDEIGFDGNWNTSFQALGGSESLEAVRGLKDFFFEHRLVPSSVAWPAGLNYNGGITYDCATASFVEEDNAYDFSQLGPEYIDGVGWNGVGFPSFQIMQFVNNSTPRPDDFCGVPRGPTHYGTDAYNAEWSKLLAAIDAYLKAHGWADKGYYYVQNEPQGPDDYELAAFLAKLAKDAAPGLRIAVSEEPKPEIAESAGIGGARYDLWWADLSEFDPEYAPVRQAAGDKVWWYFLYGDLPPHFNPITIDHPGIESRIPFWSAYNYRVRGFAYYSVTGWGDDPRANPRPQGTNQNGDGFLLYPPESGSLVTSIRWENLREGAEDYEYLLLAAGGSLPAAPGSEVGCDASAKSAAASTTSFTRDAAAFLHLRDELGYYLEGQRDGCPVLDSKPEGAHPRAEYRINFQDPAGPPDASPLVVDGEEWLKIGWEGYDAKQGYGWSGPYIGDASIMLYQYLSDAPVSELQKSIAYNDYGRTDTFTWDIENGAYKVTVSIGWYGKTYSKHRVFVEGQPLFDSVETTPDEPYKEASLTVDVTDGNITIEAGQKDEYTMLNWLRIEPQ